MEKEVGAALSFLLHCLSRAYAAPPQATTYVEYIYIPKGREKERLHRKSIALSRASQREGQGGKGGEEEKKCSDLSVKQAEVTFCT